MANKVNYTFRFDPDLIQRVDEVAKKEMRSRTNMIEIMIHDYLKQLRKKDRLSQDNDK